MGYVILGALVVAVVIVLLVVQALLLPAVISGVLLAATGYTAVRFGQHAWTVLTVRHPGGPSPDPVPAGSTWRPYPLERGWRDVEQVVRGSGSQVGQTLYRLHRQLFRSAKENFGAFALVGLPLWFGLVGGTLLVAVPLAAGLAALLAALLGLLALWALGWLVTVSTAGLADLALRTLRRMVVACPHPGCYHRFGLPVYACPDPSCSQRHTRLFPNQHGAVRHACQCGASLPTLVLLGRYRLDAFCPRCDRPLPGRVGRARTEHVPVVGGPDAGKSTFLCLVIDAYRRSVTSGGGTVDYPHQHDEQRWAAALAELRRGNRLAKTQETLPRAVMLDVRPPGGDGRILYLFDPAGETYDSSETVDSQRYLDHAEVAIVVVDPLAIASVAEGFTDADRGVVAQAAAPNQAQVTREGPGEAVDRLTGMLRSRPAGGRLRRLLVVVTKADVLRRTSVGVPLGGDAPDIAGWLTDVGWGNWVRSLAECSGEIRYLASGLDIDDSTLAEQLGWLTGTAVRRQRRGWLPRRRRRHHRRPWAAGSRVGRIPAGHVAGRRVIGLVAAPVAVLAGVAAALAVVIPLLSSYAD